MFKSTDNITIWVKNELKRESKYDTNNNSKQYSWINIEEHFRQIFLYGREQ